MENKAIQYNIMLGEKIDKLFIGKMQKEIAKKMNTSPENLSKFINNLKKGKGITTTSLFSIINALDVEISTLFTKENPKG